MKSLTNLPDQELIRLYTEGNSQSLSALVLRYKDKLYTSIFLLVRDRHLAEDFFQDTFCKIIDIISAGRYKEEGKFLPWAMRIAHNLCIDHFRKVRRTPVIKTGEGLDLFESLNFAELSSEDRMMRDQSRNSVSKMIDRLPEDQREIIVLRHYADLSFKEIAALTNCSINTALGRMRYALINLRNMVKEKQIAL